MSLTGDLYAHLADQSAITDLVSTRIYPEWNASVNETFPYIVYTIIGQERRPHLNAAAGMVRTSLQIDVYGSSTRSVEAVADAVRGELDGFTGTMNSATVVRECHLEARRNGHETDGEAGSSGIFRSSMDFYLWHTETVPTFA